jgi:hypothetical protein
MIANQLQAGGCPGFQTPQIFWLGRVALGAADLEGDVDTFQLASHVLHAARNEEVCSAYFSCWSARLAFTASAITNT